MRSLRPGVIVSIGVLATASVLAVVAVPAYAAKPSCKFTASLLNAPLHTKFGKKVLVLKPQHGQRRVGGVTLSYTEYQCGYQTLKGSTRVGFQVALRLPFSKAAHAQELAGTRVLASNNAEDGATFATYAPLAGNEAYFYGLPTSPETTEVSVYGYAWSHGGEVIIRTGFDKGKESTSTLGKALKVVLARVVL